MPNSDFQQLQLAIETDSKLYSVFERITLGNARLKLNSQHEKRVLTNDTIVRGKGPEFRVSLLSDWEKLEKLHPLAQDLTLPHLFQKYGWRIGNPERTSDNEFAVAYCDSFRLDKILGACTNDHKFILLKGDLAGIQKYIYGNIQPKQAGGLRNIAKKLRGRSVIISLLTDFLAGVIQRELGLSPWHLLFAGGGHFNMLIPEEKLSKLNETIIQIDAQIRERFGDNLLLVVAHNVFEKQYLLDKPSICFSEVNRILEQKKFQPHKNLLSQHFVVHKTLDVDITKDEIDLGRVFPKQKYLIETFSTEELKRNQTCTIFSLKTSAGFHSLFGAKGLDDVDRFLLSNTEKGIKSTQIYTLNQTDILPSDVDWDYNKWDSVSFGFRFLGKTLPFDEASEQPKTFEEIVKEGDDENKLLAALRLDIDDLGFIFSRGMPNASLGEILTLSREIQYFFSAHFDYLAARKEHDLYLIYSGGDDAFAVGKWDNVIHFARKLRADFQEFVFQNADVHFSAGVFMGNPHYPVGRFYHDAVAYQNDAKNSNDRKNRIKIFNQTLDWEEFDSKIKLGETFAKVFDGKEEGMKKLPSAFAYRILNLVKSSFRERVYQDREGNWFNRGSVDTERFARNVAGLRYFFARQGFDEKRAKESVDKIEKELIWDFLRSFDFGDDEKIYPLRDYLVALNYAIFKNRAKAN